MDRVFLDANVLWSAAYKEGSRLAKLWGLDDVQLLTSDYAIAEASRNTAEPAQRTRMGQLLLDLEVVQIASEQALPAANLAAKDRPILAAAIAGNATHLLTGDKAHFGPLYGQVISGVLILRPSDYLSSRSA